MLGMEVTNEGTGKQRYVELSSHKMNIFLWYLPQARSLEENVFLKVLLQVLLPDYMPPKDLLWDVRILSLHVASAYLIPVLIS